MSSYSDAKYGVRLRKWWGLTKKNGGQASSGCTFGTTDATTIDHVTRWYPQGKIRMLKAGHMVLATIGGGATVFDYVPARVLVNGSTETAADWQVEDAAAPYAVASYTSFTNPVVDNGSYVGIRTGTPVSDNGTDAKSATVTGTVAFFIDYRREYVYGNGDWDR